MKLKLDQKGDAYLWLPRKSHFLFKITDDMKVEINKQYVQATLSVFTFWETSFTLFVFADSYA